MKKYQKSFYHAGMAQLHYKKADAAMRSREHGKWHEFYANECLTDMKQTAWVMAGGKSGRRTTLLSVAERLSVCGGGSESHAGDEYGKSLDRRRTVPVDEGKMGEIILKDKGRHDFKRDAPYLLARRSCRNLSSVNQPFYIK